MGKVALRKIDENDFKAFSELLSNVQVMEFSEGALSHIGIKVWFDAVIQQYAVGDGFGTFAIVLIENEQVIGYCSLLVSSYTQLPEIGYRILPAFWGKGLATEAAHLIVKYAFEQLRLSALFAQVDPHNLGSLGVVRKLGMQFSHEIQPDGYDYADQIWMLERENNQNIN